MCRRCAPGQSAEAPFSVDLQRWWQSLPGRRRSLGLFAAGKHLQLAHLVELGRLARRLGHRQTLALHLVAHDESVLHLHAGTDAHGEDSFLAVNAAFHPQQIAQIRLTALVKRTIEPDARLHAEDVSLPHKLMRHLDSSISIVKASRG